MESRPGGLAWCARARPGDRQWQMAMQASFPGIGASYSAPMIFAIGLGSPLMVFVLASAIFRLIDVRRDHCLGVPGQQLLRNLTEGVPNRTGFRG